MMNFTDLKYKLNEFWKDFKQIKSGLFGVFLLLLLLFLLFFEPLIIGFPETDTRWRDITYWEDNPQSAPPAWTNFFSKEKASLSNNLEIKESLLNEAQNINIYDISFEYDYKYDVPPKEILTISKNNINNTESKSNRIGLSKSSNDAAYNLLKKYDVNSTTTLNKTNLKGLEVLFSVAEKDMYSKANPLKGTYTFNVKILNPGGNGELSNSTMKIVGSVHGILGTDSSKRDLWSGLIVGVKWALFIGLFTSTISVLLGVIYGVISAFFGGFVDSVMQRIFELFVSVPLLPILIVMSAIFKPSIWILVFIMCAFFWVGPVRTVRSIGFQIKEETFIESSKALGASKSRLIFKHMVPLLIPYSFASMALSVPMAIVYEATISVIGLGDSSIVTWGQMLQDALSAGAVTQGIWWWVVPPGLMIAIVGMTFAFIGFAMDKILLPKLKTR
jgi:peptide/nickel transport system permease protein